MWYLVVVNLIWAFSFPLIGHYLAKDVDIYFSILVRFALALLVFLPFIDTRLRFSLKLRLVAIGAIESGLMYIFYFQAFKFLSVAEVALFTIFTPFYVSVIYDIFAKRFRYLYLLSVGLAVLGAYIIKYGEINEGFLAGFLLLQMANLCFGLGQSLYKHTIETHNLNAQRGLFAYFYFGAFGVGLASFVLLGDLGRLPQNSTQWGILIYLGVIASGLGYFMWNKGASIVDSGILAIMNNVLIPLAILVNFLFWDSHIENVERFIIGSVVIILSLVLHYKILAFYKER